MSPELARALLVVAVVGCALLVAGVVRRYRRPEHPDITVGDVGDRPGVVLFTSTDCHNCKEVIALLERESIPFREVTHDLEPHRFDTWDVVAVPLTVVLDEDGNTVGTLSGIPKVKHLMKAVENAGVVLR